MMMQGCKETKSSVPVTATPESLGDSGVSAQRNPRSCTDKKPRRRGSESPFRTNRKLPQSFNGAAFQKIVGADRP